MLKYQKNVYRVLCCAQICFESTEKILRNDQQYLDMGNRKGGCQRNSSVTDSKLGCFEKHSRLKMSEGLGKLFSISTNQ